MGRWSFLLNRYFVTFGTIVAVTLAWNVFIAFNNDGIVEGRVIGPDGQPVAGAMVVLSERTLLVTEARAHATTGADGQFMFTGHKFHRIWLEAHKPGVGDYPQTEYRMYFRSQNLTLDKPLQLQPAPADGRSGKSS